MVSMIGMVTLMTMMLSMFSTMPGVFVDARPLVRHIKSTHEFERVLQKHATETGLPIIVDFYSDGCGPCRQMAPIFQKLAKQKVGEAVFVKVDTNAMHELSGKYGIRSLPTFVFFLGGKKVNEFSGAGEAQLKQFTDGVISRAQRDNVLLTAESLASYYQKVDPSKTPESVTGVWDKCASQIKVKGDKVCAGGAATALARKLKQKYKEAPALDKRFQAEEQESKSEEKSKNDPNNKKGKGSSSKPNLQFATKEELLAEIEKRQDAEEDEHVEEEEDDDAEFQHGWAQGDYPEKVAIIGGGPAGMAAAIYAARAGLEPVVVAPPLGGQLQGKGVDVENYPGLFNVTGPAVIAAMREQAIAFGTRFEMDAVSRVEKTLPDGPFRIYTNATGAVIETHAVIVATGAEAKWLGVAGEWEYRGGGVSSCATCDGAAFYNQHVLVVGGGDAAMEDALVLARTSQKVTVIHRRDSFRASKILAERVKSHPKIVVQWNSTLDEIHGAAEVVQQEADDNDSEDMDLDSSSDVKKYVTGVTISTTTEDGSVETKQLTCSAVFVAIGHLPATSFLEGVVEFDPERPGYVQVLEGSTKTSAHGIFAAGDVADSVYRQAITSAGSGAAAALDAERWLSEENLGNEAAELEAELLRELMEDMPSGAGATESYNVYADSSSLGRGMKEDMNIEIDINMAAAPEAATAGEL
jgi:thioredoxin reductase (NADPH)